MPTVAVLVFTWLVCSSVRAPNLRIVCDGASLYLPKIENRVLNVWSIRALPAFSVALFEYAPVNFAVKSSAATGPLGWGKALRNGIIAADAAGDVFPARASA